MISLKYQKGFNLIEIMVAVAISAVLIGGILQIFLSNKQTYRTLSAMSELQENARFALVLLGKSIRGADNWGCISDRSLVNGASYTRGIDGQDGTTDSIILSGAFNSPVDIITAKSNVVNVASANGLKVAQDVIVGDCRSAQINTIAAISGSQITLSTALNRDYAADATIQPVRRIAYSIATGANGLPALMYDDGDGFLYELINGVENMQISYGEDTDGDRVPDYFVDVGSVVDRENVYSIKIRLLLVSSEEVASKALSYTFNGQSYTASDRRLRKVFENTYALRNRLP